MYIIGNFFNGYEGEIEPQILGRWLNGRLLSLSRMQNE